jgi:hypothetical protein
MAEPASIGLQQSNRSQCSGPPDDVTTSDRIANDPIPKAALDYAESSNPSRAR